MNKDRMYDVLYVSFGNIAVLTLIYVAILIFRPGLYGMILIISCSALALNAKRVWANRRCPAEYRRLFLDLIQLICIVIALYYIVRWLGVYGLIGELLIILAIASWRIIVNWSMYMESLRDVETQIWGRPLDREQWKNAKPAMGGLKTMKKKTKYRKVPRWLAYSSWICFCLIGILAIVSETINVMNQLYLGLHPLYYAGYLAGMTIVAFLAWLVPIYMMSVYIRKVYREEITENKHDAT